MSKAVKLARAVGTGGVLEDGEIQAAQVTGLATVASTNSYTDLINKPTIPSITGLASETYVNTQINNLINGAPGTLDTLKEIADQLALDESAVGALTTVVNSKASTASLAAVATTGSFSDLINKPTTLSGYGITNAQPLDADLTSIAGLTGTTGLLKKTAANTWSLDTTKYMQAYTLGIPPSYNSPVVVLDPYGDGSQPLNVVDLGDYALRNNPVFTSTTNIQGPISLGATTTNKGSAGQVITSAGASNVPTWTTLATVAYTNSYNDLTNKPTIGDALPTQTGNSGKYLTTNGTTASWATLNVLNRLPITLNSGTTTNISVAQGYVGVLSRDGTTITNIAVTS